MIQNNPFNQAKEFIRDLNELTNEVRKEQATSNKNDADVRIQEKITTTLSKWNTSGTSITDLAERVKSLSQESKAFSQEELIGAVEGAAIILNQYAKNKEQVPFIQKALKNLTEAYGALHSQSTELKQDSSSQLNVNENTKPASSYWSTWKIPTMSTSLLGSSWGQAVLPENSENLKELESTYVKRLPKTPPPLLKPLEALQELQRQYPFMQVHASGIIRELIQDPVLNGTITISNPENTEQLVILDQFNMDFHRVELIEINGKIYAKLGQTSEDNSKKFSIYKEMILALTPVTFARLGTLLNQANSADTTKYLNFKAEPPLIGQVFFGNIDEFAPEYHLKVNKDVVEIQIDSLFKASAQAEHGEMKPVGYIGMRWDIKVPRSEFDQNLDGLKPDQIMPHLEAVKTYSGIFPDPQGAQRALRSTLYRRIGSYLY